MIVVWLFLTMSRVCLQFVIVVLPDHTHYFRKRTNLNLAVNYVSIVFGNLCKLLDPDSWKNCLKK